MKKLRLKTALNKGYKINDIYFSMSLKEWCIFCILNDNGYDYLETNFWLKNLPNYIRPHHFTEDIQKGEHIIKTSIYFRE